MNQSKYLNCPGAYLCIFLEGLWLPTTKCQNFLDYCSLFSNFFPTFYNCVDSDSWSWPRLLHVLASRHWLTFSIFKQNLQTLWNDDWVYLGVCVCVCSRCMISMLCSVCTFFQIYNSIIIYNPRIFVNKDYYTYIYIYILPQSVFTHMDMPVKLQNNTSKNT